MSRLASKGYVDMGMKGLIDGSFHIQFEASKQNINDDDFKIEFPSDDTTEGLLVDSSSGMKYKKIIPSSDPMTPTQDAVCYVSNVKINSYPYNNRYADGVTSSLTTVKGLMYQVQHDSIVHMFVSGGSSRSFDFGVIYLYYGGPTGNGDPLDLSNYVKMFTSVESYGGSDLEPSFIFPCKKGTRFLFVYGNAKIGHIQTSMDDEGRDGGIASVKPNLTSCYYTESNWASNKQKLTGFKVTVTEFKLKNWMEQIDLGGSGSGGGDSGGGDSGGDSGGSDTTTSVGNISLLNINSPVTSNESYSVSDEIDGESYTYSVTRSVSGSNYTYTFTIPKFRATQVGLDFCCANIPVQKMTMTIDGTVIANSQNFPNNIAGFQTFIPISVSDASNETMTIVISGCSATIEHAHVTVFRS